MRSSDFAPLVIDQPAVHPPGFGPFGPAPTDAAGSSTVAAEARPETSEESQRAFQAGYELGRQEVTGQMEQVAESLVRSLEEVAEFRARLRDRYERELLEVALGVARKIVQQELADRPDIWLGMIRAAVRRIVDRERIVVRVPAEIARFLHEADRQLRASLDEVKELEVVEDPTLPPDGCRIESRFGEVDLGLDTQFEAAQRALVRSEE